MSGSYWWIKAGDRADFDAGHPWGMPGIICPHCGNTWGRTGPALPSVSFGGDPLGGRLNRWPVPLAQWRELAKAVRARTPASEPIVPGLAFGPLSGELYRPFRIGWHGRWGLVVTSALQREFAELAPGVALVPADLGVPETYLEVEVRTDGAVANMADTAHCSECGFTDRHLDGDRLVLRDLRLDLPVFRPPELPSGHHRGGTPAPLPPPRARRPGRVREGGPGGVTILVRSPG